MPDNVVVDEDGATRTLRNVRTAMNPRARTVPGTVPDPRFAPASHEADDDDTRTTRRARHTADTAQSNVRRQGAQNRTGTQDLAGTKTTPSPNRTPATTPATTPNPQWSQQLAAQQQRILQLLSQPAQQMAAQQMQQTPAVMQGMAQGAVTTGSQYPPGSVSLSREQIAALLAAVDQSGGGDGPGGAGDVRTTGQVSNKGAINVSEVQYQKTGTGPLSKSEADRVIIAACEANGITDKNAQAQWLQTMRNVHEHESTRNPDAVNNSDSNAVGAPAADGSPAKSSRGIAQCIPPTFAAYHVAGTSTNIYDPVANTAASINYISHRYGGGVKDGSTLASFNAARSGSYVGY
jgi:SLT domain-containing protein